MNVIHSIECTNGDIDVKVENGTRLYGKIQEYPITVKKRFGKYQYPENGMFSPDKWLNPEEKKELTEFLEEKYNISIEN